MIEITFNNKSVINLESPASGSHINNVVANKVNFTDFYLIHNGKLLHGKSFVTDGPVHIIPRINGGKGGFGSMLRAIGAQIEKTTNREACRDLSGRRLRDINEEKRLKNWIDKQVNREQEIEEKRKEKLEKLLKKPNHEFKDEAYEKERSAIPERVEDAISQGLQAAKELSAGTSGTACSTSSGKRKHEAENDTKKKKKKKAALWVEDGLELSSSSDTNSDSDDEKSEKIQQVA